MSYETDGCAMLYRTGYDAGYTKGREDGYNTAKADSPRPDWTPCAEGLPDADAKDANGKDIVYLCTIQTPLRNCDIIREYCYGTHIGFDGKDCVGWFFNGDYRGSIYSDISIAAWMPKPAPYNPDRKED